MTGNSSKEKVFIYNNGLKSFILIWITPLILVTALSNVTYSFKNSQTMKLSSQPHLLSSFNTSVSFSSVIYDPCNQKQTMCLLFFCFITLVRGGAQKHPNHDTNTHHTLWNQFPSFAKPDEEECHENWPRACDKRDQHIRCLHADGAQICHWCVKPRWPTQHPLSPQVKCNYRILATAAAPAERGGYWIL